MRQGRRATTGFLGEFRDFLLRGNVIDLAIAVILGGAFGKIIDSLVTDILTPLILSPALKAAQVDKLSELSAGGIQYGLFLAAVLNFLVIALCIFLLVRTVASMQRRFERQKEMEAAEAPDPVLIAQENLTQSIDRLTSVMESQR